MKPRLATSAWGWRYQRARKLCSRTGTGLVAGNVAKLKEDGEAKTEHRRRTTSRVVRYKGESHDRTESQRRGICHIIVERAYRERERVSGRGGGG